MPWRLATRTRGRAAAKKHTKTAKGGSRPKTSHGARAGNDLRAGCASIAVASSASLPKRARAPRDGIFIMACGVLGLDEIGKMVVQFAQIAAYVPGCVPEASKPSRNASNGM